MPKPWQVLLDTLSSKASADGIFDHIKPSSDPNDVIQICYYASEGFYRNSIMTWMKESIGNHDAHKSSSKAEKFRQLGNKKFVACDNVGSLDSYTAGICCAPESSPELPLALGNRSAVLFHLEKYEESLRDIDAALQRGFPQALQHKLYTRQSKCFRKLGQFEKEVEALRRAEDSSKHVDAPKEKILSLQRDNQRAVSDALLLLAKHCDAAPGSSAQSERSPHDPTPSYEENPDFPCASSALSLQSDARRGRHVVTLRDVAAGDTLFVEEPFASVALPDHESTRCHHCCVLLVAPTPCWECSGVLYCREECRGASWGAYHRWECRGLRLLHAVGIAHLALRVALQAGPSPGEDHPRVVALLSHLADMKCQDTFQYALTALLLTLYLREHTSYFGAGETGEVLAVAGRVLTHVGQLVCNGHAVTELDSPRAPGAVVSEAQVRVATALYPSAAMMNHSCQPDVANSFLGRRLVVRACRDLPRGSEVFNCYGPHYRHLDRQRRQEILRQQYFFTCECEPCTKPEFCSYLDRFSAWRCPQCSGPQVPAPDSPRDTGRVQCCDCGHSDASFAPRAADLLRARDLFEEGCRRLESGDVDTALESLLACLEARESWLYQHHTELTCCLDQLAKCYAAAGDYRTSARYLCRTLPAVRERFGTDSLEVAHELQKLTDVEMCELRTLPLHSTHFGNKSRAVAGHLDDALCILDVCCGPWTSEFQEIMAKKVELQQMTYPLSEPLENTRYKNYFVNSD